jgi:hypothetical protein
MSTVRYSGPYPTLPITKKQFDRLGEIYGINLSSSDKIAVQDLANDYLAWRVRELVSHSRSETRALFEEVKEAVEPFIRFVSGGLLGFGDAACELEGLLADQYGNCVVRLQSNWLRIQMEDNGLHVPEVRQPVLLALNPTVLMHMGEVLSQILTGVGRSIEWDEKKGHKGFAPGVAFRDLLWHLREWAKAAGYPISPFKNAGRDAAFDAPDKEASPFSKFITELLTILGRAPIPTDLRTAEGIPIISLAEEIGSAEAVAERLKAVAAKANALARQGGY